MMRWAVPSSVMSSVSSARVLKRGSFTSVKQLDMLNQSGADIERSKWRVRRIANAQFYCDADEPARGDDADVFIETSLPKSGRAVSMKPPGSLSWAGFTMSLLTTWVMRGKGGLGVSPHGVDAWVVSNTGSRRGSSASGRDRAIRLQEYGSR